MVKITWLTKTGILIFIIGVSFLACAFYRSGSTNSFGYGLLEFMPLKPDAWNPDSNVGFTFPYFWAPRTLRMEIKTNAPLDVYLLDSYGMQKWVNEGKLEPTLTFENTQTQIATVEIPHRGNYALLIHNPTSDNAGYEINSTIYGYEKDLLWIGIGAAVAGIILAAASLASSWRSNKK
ncbi:MAG: hypothetical protein NWF05_05890 [Candidatus Bathyarchaeota archaeon]|nr:hypothetical protein [Candidatus Bathyarchaeota archaeon]